MESRATKKGAKKLVSSNVAKILEKESSDKIREISEKTMFTPSNPNKTTAESYCYCLVIRTLPYANINLATRYRQVVSEYLATSVCRTTSDDLAIKEDCQRVLRDICLPDHKQ